MFLDLQTYLRVYLVLLVLKPSSQDLWLFDSNHNLVDKAYFLYQLLSLPRK